MKKKVDISQIYQMEWLFSLLWNILNKLEHLLEIYSWVCVRKMSGKYFTIEI